MNSDAFYDELTRRNRGFISDDQQDALRRATVLVAGCGAIGGAAIEPLVRAGAGSLVLVDYAQYATEDAGRESVRVQDIGRNKVSVIAERMLEINPFVGIRACINGVTADNVSSFVSTSDLIIDGISAAETSALRAKVALHQAGLRLRKPVISGYDVAGTLWSAVYDYRNPDVKLFDGKCLDVEVGDLTPAEFLSRLFASVKLPIEMLPAFERQMTGQSNVTPALGYTPAVFGAIAVHLTFELLTSRPVRRSIHLDIPSLVRPRRERLKVAGRRLAMLYTMNQRLKDLQKSGRLGVYSPLDDEVFADLRAYMEERVWESGSVIVRQGDPGRDFFVVVDGEVQVEREFDDEEREPEIIARLGIGQFFGELSLLTDQPRNASVVASTRCAVLSLSRDAFETYLEESSAAKQRLLEIAKGRIRSPMDDSTLPSPVNDSNA